MNFNQDERAIRYCDVFAEATKGNVNVSIVYPGTVAAWHRHKIQTDYWFVVKGTLKVGLWDEEKKTKEFKCLSDKNPEVLKIPPNTWHGYYNFTPDPAILIYCTTEKYNPKDEERKEIIAADWERKIQ